VTFPRSQLRPGHRHPRRAATRHPGQPAAGRRGRAPTTSAVPRTQRLPQPSQKPGHREADDSRPFRRDT